MEHTDTQHTHDQTHSHTITDRNDCTNVQFGEPMNFFIGATKRNVGEGAEGGGMAQKQPPHQKSHPSIGERFWSSLPCVK